MSAALPLGDPGRPAVERARQRLYEEIERLRRELEEMLTGQAGGEGESVRLQSELEALRKETRRYVKRRIRKSERRLEDSMRRTDDRIRELERRLEGFERDRMYAEWRIHTNTEAMLDGILRELRLVADLLTRR